MANTVFTSELSLYLAASLGFPIRHHAQMRAGTFKCICKRRIKCKCKSKNTASESNENVNANAQQLNQMQVHLDQMQMLFYNYVFLR